VLTERGHIPIVTRFSTRDLSRELPLITQLWRLNAKVTYFSGQLDMSSLGPNGSAVV